MQTATATNQSAPTADDGERDAILAALDRFIRSRPGFDPANYAGAPAAYRADSRTAQRDRADALDLLAAVACRNVAAQYLLDELTRGNRLTWDRETRSLHYTAGRYYPTEYRALASALWAYWRDRMPEPSAWRVECRDDGGGFGPATSRLFDSRESADVYARTVARSRLPCAIALYGTKRECAGDYLRRVARDALGSRLARRWYA